MGADLLIADIAIETDKQPDWKAGRRWIRETPAKEIRKATRHAFYNSRGEEPETVAEIRTWLRDVVSEVQAAIENEYRDCTWITVPGWTIYLTGGMSWGDNPSESFQPFLDLREVIPLAAAIGFWAPVQVIEIPAGS